MYFKAAFASSEKIMCFYGLTSREYPLITGSTYKNISCIFWIFLQILHKADYYNQSKQSITSRSSWSSNRSSFLGKKCLGVLIEIQKSGSTMSCAISQLVYMPNFRAIDRGTSVWRKMRTHWHTETHTWILLKLNKNINSR